MQDDSQSHDTFSPEQFKEKVKADEQEEIMLAAFLESRPRLYEAMKKKKKKINPYKKGIASFFPAPLISEQQKFHRSMNMVACSWRDSVIEQQQQALIVNQFLGSDVGLLNAFPVCISLKETNSQVICRLNAKLKNSTDTNF